MAIIAQLQAFTRECASGDGASRQSYVGFLFHVKRICRKAFTFLHTISLK